MTDDSSPVGRRRVLKTIGGIAIASGGVVGRVAASSTITVPDDYSTITDAVNNANPDDTVLVKSGDYREQVIVRKDLTVRADGEVTLYAPEGSLGVGGFPLLQPIFGVGGTDVTVDLEGLTIDGEGQTDKDSVWYTGVAYFQADGQVRDVEVTGTTGSGIYVTQNRGGGGSQNVDVLNSHFENIGAGGGIDTHVTHNEPGTTGKVQNCTFVGDGGETDYLYGASPGYGASVTYQDNTFRDFYGGSFQLGFYGFNTPDCTIQGNQFQACQYPVYIASTTERNSSTADEQRVVKNDIDGSGLPNDLISYGTTLFAYDTNDSDGRVESVNNAKIVNNDYSNLDFGVSLNATGEGAVNNAKVIRNEFENVDQPFESNGDQDTTKQANRV